MVTKRVLLFGGTGQIGQALQNHPLPPGWHLGVCGRIQADIRHPGAIAKAMRDFAPDLVINAAALTDVDACERDPDLAMRVNFEAVATMAAHCAAMNAPLIQISTDYVFDGTDGEAPYASDAAMNPVNEYGKSKLMGEEAARHGLYWHIVLRTSLVFSAFGNNVLTKTLEAFDTRDEIGFAADQTANPTSAEAVAEALAIMGDAILMGKADGFGTFHLCGTPAATRYEFGQAVWDAYAPFTTRRPKIVPVNNADVPGRAPRPACTILDCSKTQRVYGLAQRSWRDDLAVAVQQLVKARQKL